VQRSDFHYELPEELIAQQPPAERSAGRLLAFDGATGGLADGRIVDLPHLLRPGDLLVFNDTRVVAARVHGMKPSGGKVEILLERQVAPDEALVQMRASKPIRPALEIETPAGVLVVIGREDDLWRIRTPGDALAFFERAGEVPLPPYIHRTPDATDRERYQTVFARVPGSVAAPTASLHFDATLLDALEARGVSRAFVTLHVGAGTFQPVRVDDLAKHVMHSERLVVSADTCRAIERTRAAGGRVVAVGTTVMRTLETAALEGVPLQPFDGESRLFIHPGFRFRVVDALLTNFHLPESTLLMLVCAFGGHSAVMRAYAHAVAQRYRFFSYGDAMLLTAEPGVRG
jgi:S-adenosylmethionine:tRNA ribosyltransferase-isomerase